MRLHIRDFTDTDTPRLKKLIGIYNTFFEEIDPWKKIKYRSNAVDFYFNQMMQQTKLNGKFLVAEVDGTIIGFIQGHVHKPTKTEVMERGNFKSGDIDNLFLLEAFRRNGIGKMLMRELELFFVTQGCTSIALNVFGPNTTAQEFYKNLGFSTRAMIMVKPLPTH